MLCKLQRPLKFEKMTTNPKKLHHPNLIMKDFMKNCHKTVHRKVRQLIVFRLMVFKGIREKCRMNSLVIVFSEILVCSYFMGTRIFCFLYQDISQYLSIILVDTKLFDLPVVLLTHYFITQTVLVIFCQFSMSFFMPGWITNAMLEVYEHNNELTWKFNPFGCPSTSRRKYENITISLSIFLLTISGVAFLIIAFQIIPPWLLLIAQNMNLLSVSGFFAILLSLINLTLMTLVNFDVLLFTTFGALMLYLLVHSQKTRFLYSNKTLSKILLYRRSITHRLEQELSSWYRWRKRQMQIFFGLNRFGGLMYTMILFIIGVRTSMEIHFVFSNDNWIHRVTFFLVVIFESFYIFFSHYILASFISIIKQPTMMFFRFTSGMRVKQLKNYQILNLLKISSVVGDLNNTQRPYAWNYAGCGTVESRSLGKVSFVL